MYPAEWRGHNFRCEQRSHFDVILQQRLKINLMMSTVINKSILINFLSRLFDYLINLFFLNERSQADKNISKSL